MGSDHLNRALITGASSGIGKAIAIAFAKTGIDVALVGRSLDRLQPVVAAAADYGVVAKPYAIDLAEVDHVKPRIQDLLTDFGPISLLVNNAGLGYTGALATMSLEDWQQVMGLNLTSVFQCIQAALPTLRDQSGTIVNIASVAGKSGFPDWGAYSVSKAGLITLSKVLSAEERSHGVRVVTVSPGAVNTPIWDTDTVHADFDRTQMLTPEVVAQTVLNAVLLPSYAVIEEISLMPSAGAL
ncbi:short-chain dehydrogenase [filamentous cyanobacterium CCP5]|nr:short-chain dehydrogenase [filamentous cyanobacterium CCP5]